MGAVKKKTKLLFESLSHPARLMMIELMAVRPRKNRELAKALGVSESSLSHHIQHLRDVPGLLVTEREGQVDVHSVDRNVLAEALVDFGTSSGLDVAIH